MSFAPRLPDPQFRSLQDVEGWARDLVRKLQDALDNLSTPAGTGYQVSNHTETRVIDAGATNLAEVTNVLCTLIEDLKTGKQGTILG